jgi:hypothetical protein
MFVEALERHFVLTERNPCVASTLTTPGLVISRLSQAIKTMPRSTLLPLDIGLGHYPDQDSSIEFVLTQ